MVTTHSPAVQPVGHVSPQPPQLFASVSASTQAPPHTVPPAHTHAPPPLAGLHAGADSGQATALPHWPPDVHVSTAEPASPPAHRAAIGMHATHVPARQLGRSPEQGAPTGCQVPD